MDSRTTASGAAESGAEARIREAHGIVFGNAMPFPDDEVYGPNGVSRQHADRLHRRNWSELHEPRLLSWRNVATISARIDSAISAGETAPISRPIGA